MATVTAAAPPAPSPSPSPSSPRRRRRAAEAAQEGGPGGRVRRQRLRQQHAARLPGQPRLLPEHRGLAGPGRRPHLHPAQGARGPAAVPDRSTSSRTCSSWPSSSSRALFVVLGIRELVVAADEACRAFWRTYVGGRAVAAGLGAYIYFVERKQAGAAGREAEGEGLHLRQAKVRSSRSRPGRRGRSGWSRRRTGWRMTAPPPTSPRTRRRSTRCSSSLEGLRDEEVVAERPPTSREYGLDTPKPRVTRRAAKASSEPLVLLSATRRPTAARVYAKTPARPRVFTVRVLPARRRFDKKPFDLRDRDVLHVKRDAVRALEVSGPEGGYALARDDAGEWAFTQPLATQAGRWSVDGLLGSLETPAHGVGRRRGRRRTSSPSAWTSPRARSRWALATARARRWRSAARRGRQEVPRARGRPPAGGGDPGRARGRPGQGHGRAARQAAARGRDLRGRRLRASRRAG